MDYKTSMECLISGDFLFTTDCKEIYKKLNRDKGFDLVIWGVHTDYWAFDASFPSTEEALDFINNLTNETAVLKEDKWVIDHFDSLSRESKNKFSTGMYEAVIYYKGHQNSLPESTND